MKKPKRSTRQRAVEKFVDIMRNGHDLQLTLGQTGGPSWDLTNGMHVPTETAKLITVHYQVEPCGDALFGDTTSQTYRHKSPWPKLT
ncbi:hypothetical protein [Bradyrhizobium sp. DASA03120]|uniref:hypothetical protein n=1 Tax=Bradyrhizobium sp. SMVTL-02 TaxID=3395917 RepID=UPI003F6FDC85